MASILAFFGSLGTWEIVLILVVLLLLFGTRLPKVARSMGQSMSEFKKGVRGVKDDIERAGAEEEEDAAKKS